MISPAKIILNGIKSRIEKSSPIKKLDSCLWELDFNSDVLQCYGWGLTSDFKQAEKLLLVSKEKNIKVSDNEELSGVFLSRLKNDLNVKKIIYAYITMNFKDKKIQTEIYFINKNDQKRKFTEEQLF